jgi:hypothetical protein
LRTLLLSAQRRAGSRRCAGMTQRDDIRNRIPPEPKDFILVVQPDGTLKANYSMWHVINRRMREKRMRGE